MRRLAILSGGFVLMVLAARLLMATGGTGIFTPPPAPSPPADDSWSRDAANPIITSDEAWDGAWVLEPAVLYEGGTFKMIYTGDNNNTDSQQLGYATSTDGVNWTKYGGNPVFGGGVGGEAHAVTQPALFKVGATYWLYYRSSADYLCIATSTDLVTWSVAHTDIITNPDGQTEWNNTSVVVDGGTWHMLAEGAKSGIWKIYYWTSSDGVSWSAGNSGNPITTLQVAAGGMWGGPFLWPVQIGGLWHLWYHAAPSSGTLPTNIYHATSSDFINWTQTSPNPVLTYTGGASYEHDQVADPCIVIVGSTAYLFFDGDNNDTFTGAIGLATASAV